MQQFEVSMAYRERHVERTQICMERKGKVDKTKQYYITRRVKEVEERIRKKGVIDLHYE